MWVLFWSRCAAKNSMGLSGLSFANMERPCWRTGTTVWSKYARVGSDWRSTICLTVLSVLDLSESSILDAWLSRLWSMSVLSSAFVLRFSMILSEVQGPSMILMLLFSFFFLNFNGGLQPDMTMHSATYCNGECSVMTICLFFFTFGFAKPDSKCWDINNIIMLLLL